MAIKVLRDEGRFSGPRVRFICLRFVGCHSSVYMHVARPPRFPKVTHTLVALCIPSVELTTEKEDIKNLKQFVI